MHNIKFITEPTIIKLAQTRIENDGIKELIHFLEQEDRKPELLELMLDNHERGMITDTDMVSEIAGRVCYQSYSKGRGSSEYFDNILEEKHGNILEHATFNMFVAGVSRSFTHELIRHRVGTGISEMSQRFVGSNEKSGRWNMVVPAIMRESFLAGDVDTVNLLNDAAEQSIEAYIVAKNVIEESLSTKYSGKELTKKVNEAAREFLPNMVETRCVWTFNTRVVRHILEKRSSVHADMQIREFSKDLWEFLGKLNLLSMKDGRLDLDKQVVFDNTGV